MLELVSAGLFSKSKTELRQNEDSILYPKKILNSYIFAIADGVGSYEGAYQASSIVTNYLSSLENLFEDSYLLLQHLIENIDSLSKENPSLSQAATTLTLCIVDELNIKILHVGDSRLYIKDGLKLKQMTTDHTQHQKLLDAGLFTKKQLKNMSGKNILTTALSKNIELEFQEICVPVKDIVDSKGEVVINIMSDGAYHYWEKRPRFSENTLSSPLAFAGSLLKRIEKNGPIDDYSLVSVKFKHL
ncbi:PP2C family protein-serine/threonine phosphatase [Acinetobacter towneri]|uniref:PP2C family protein-serine/threonine phosphatase n=1 Tax=Acinetobacter towneri TaxID=202956 RepID=UPI00209A848E|nr:protein phosphatase 2C domain-containing protein [Acinetobacter towneri]MCO8056265.1 protein phosphatase 2C domain-containing protein [Acinetobacter towneri]